MAEANNELGRVSNLKADAVGEPGSRRFRLLAESRGGGALVIWMEKEQLFNLGVALKRIIATVEEQSSAQGTEYTPAEEPEEPEVPTGQSVELQTSRLAVDYDERTLLYSIAAHGDGDDEDPDEAVAAVSLIANQQEMDALADQAFEVCAAGRPRCPLCGAPMGPEPHICPRHNGHGILEA
ncbi:MAG: DUF3090 family protein [Dehalococcoidia bacterium]